MFPIIDKRKTGIQLRKFMDEMLCGNRKICISAKNTAGKTVVYILCGIESTSSVELYYKFNDKCEDLP